MPTLSRKQREIREREITILDTARTMLLERGYLGLTMDRVAAVTEYSKGTIYHHFSSKEDLLAGLAAQSGEIRASLFERAASFRGASRERISAIGAAAEIFNLLYPHHEQAMRIIKASSIKQKATQERQQAVALCEFRCFGAATGIMRDAVAQGDLTLSEGDSVEGLTLGLWSLYMGTFMIRDLGLFIDEPDLVDPTPALLRNGQVFLDGAGWTPLSTEVDYLAIRERVLRELFAPEAKLAGLL